MKLYDDFSNIQEFEYEIEDRGFLELWEQFQEQASNGIDYEQINIWQEKFKPFGLTFDYGLDAETFDFNLN